MRLQAKTRYGVRALLAMAHGPGPSLAREIAEQERIPVRYLEQIFQGLKRAGLVAAKRGPKGGYALARAPEKITIGDVVRALQGELELVADEAGSTRELWAGLARHVAAWFEGVTLADVVARRGDRLAQMYFI